MVVILAILKLTKKIGVTISNNAGAEKCPACIDVEAIIAIKEKRSNTTEVIVDTVEPANSECSSDFVGVVYCAFSPAGQ